MIRQAKLWLYQISWGNTQLTVTYFYLIYELGVNIYTSMACPLLGITRRNDDPHVFHGSLPDDTDSTHRSRLCYIKTCGKRRATSQLEGLYNTTLAREVHQRRKST
jgi:hypothetical protein